MLEMATPIPTIELLNSQAISAHSYKDYMMIMSLLKFLPLALLLPMADLTDMQLP